ncbi:conjugative transfer ATPase [Salinicola lusitanus]|uniref:Conjugative transfer ATPase n=1 Tax=Salinicola lusitanus TaxID=1949085 RepID=A0ABZ3CV90_9GAMM
MSFNALMNRWFGNAGQSDSEAVGNDSDAPRGGRPTSVPRGKPITERDVDKLYERAPSFANYLPFIEYLPASQSFLMDDCRSVGIVAEIVPLATEGRSEEWLTAKRDLIEGAFQDALPQHDNSPWVAQIYAQDEVDYRDIMERLKAYIDCPDPESTRTSSGLLETAYTQEWLGQFERHLKSISQEGGVFHDDVVTQTHWKGQTRRTRLVLYRRLNKQAQSGRGQPLTPEEEANMVYDRLASALEGVGLTLRRYDGRDFHRWMVVWLNPRPAMSPEDPQAFYDLVEYPGDDNLPYDYDLGGDVLFKAPESDADKGLWYFDGLPHRCLVVDELRRRPDIGHITGEVKRQGSKSKVSNALMDVLPEGTVMVLTIVASPQEPLEDHINRLKDKAHGDSVLAVSVRRDCEKAKEFMAERHYLYQSSLVFYVRGEDETDLRQKCQALSTKLYQSSLKPVEPEDEIASLNTYLRWMPMAFDPDKDARNRWYTAYNYVQHLANLSPFFGRARGTGRPGLTMFNRGGETLSFDPFHLADREKNAHAFISGPTGAGKSASLTAMCAQLMAVRRPRLFILEVGNSFGLLADYFERNGLSVNKVKLSPGSGVSLAPFLEAHRLLEDEHARRRAAEDAEARARGESVDDALPAPIEDEDEEESLDEDKRDLLGEMEITARLMVTGGEEEEERRFRRADRRMVRDAIMRAARLTFEEGRPCKTEDVREAFFAISRDPDVHEETQRRANEMGMNIGLFCDGFDGEVFNSTGEPWPECDVTLVDLATYAREGYGAQLALSVISITNMITNLAERTQYDGRHIVQIIDESHVVTVNPLLSPFFVKVGKMGRKLMYWLWFATQNVEDFPAAAEKLLNMIEFWICLVMPPDEVQKIKRFKSLSPAQEELLLSASKISKKYTEGVVLASAVESLFRVVQPSLYLALSGTEGDEKKARRSIMIEKRCSELDAAIHIAKEMDAKRGFIDEAAFESGGLPQRDEDVAV